MMEPNDLNRKADALFAALNGEKPPNNTDLPRQEATLAESLRRMGQEVHPDPRFKASLEARLNNAARQNNMRPKINLHGPGLALGWIALGAVLLFSLAWIIQNALPRPAGSIPAAPTATAQPTGIAQPTQSGTALPTSTPAAVETAAPPTPIPAAPSFTSDLYPGMEWLVPAPFPEALSQASVYQQDPAEAITVESARAMAAQLGISGEVYKLDSEASGQLVYTVANSKQRVTFINTTDNFSYVADYTTVLKQSHNPLPVEQQLTTATEFLRSHGLLDFPFVVETDEIRSGMISFSPKLDELPVYYNNLGPGLINVTINAQGQVALVNYQMFHSSALGQYPIRSAQDAWQKALSNETVSGVEMISVSSMPNTYRAWQRDYPVGEPVDLYGYLEVLQPAEAGTLPFVSLNNYHVLGDLTALVQAHRPGKFFHVWGQFQLGEQGVHELQMAGWELSPYPDRSAQGLIQRQGDLAFLLTEGKQLRLPDLPAEAPEAVTVTVRGVEIAQPEPLLEWTEVSSGGGGGGGGGGGAAFAELTLDGSGATPEPRPTPIVQAGQPIDGLRGNVFVLFHRYSDGVRSADVSFYTESNAEFPQGLYATLQGAGLAGIEAYHNLPVRIWGSVTKASATLPIIEVARYEPVYPDLKVQAWLGKVENQVLDGQPVQRFTAQDGEQFVLLTSINPSEDSLAAGPGETVIVEGVLYPDHTYAGYPVISDFGAHPAGDRTSLDGYQLRNAVPMEIPETRPSGALQKATVEKIELIYQTIWLQSLSPQGAPPTYVQPVWHFFGHYEDGSTFNIMVQALTDEYLKLDGQKHD